MGKTSVHHLTAPVNQDQDQASAGSGGDALVLKHGWLTKRAQLKSLFSFTNYRERWFELTKSTFVCYDGQKPDNRKEKDRIQLKDVRVIESVSLKDGSEGRKSLLSSSSTVKHRPAFQIGYREGHSSKPDPELMFYVVAKDTEERDEWVTLIRTLCRSNAHLAAKFHPSLWASGRWVCCGDTGKNSTTGCEPVTWSPGRQAPKAGETSPATAHLITDNGGEEIVPNVAGSVPAATNGVLLEATAANPNLTTPQTAASTGKVVVAVYPFTAIEDGDLTLIKGEEYVVLDDSQDHWWEVRNKVGQVGFIPSNYVKEMDSLGLQNFDW